MHANGQDRLRIPIYHQHFGSTGTSMNSATAANRQAIADNLEDFLYDIADKGFVEVIIGFFPNHPYNQPKEWDGSSYTAAENGAAQSENFDVIMRCRQAAINSGINYRIDLLNEGAPPDSKPKWLWYIAKTWQDYTKPVSQGGTGQHTDTVGYSIIVDGWGIYNDTFEQRYDNVMAAYHTHTNLSPPLYSIHAYRDSGGNIDAIEAFHNYLVAAGDQSSWVIGECLYNDQPTKTDFNNADLGNRTVWWVIQWPISYPRGWDGHVDEAPPSLYIYDW